MFKDFLKKNYCWLVNQVEFKEIDTGILFKFFFIVILTERCMLTRLKYKDCNRNTAAYLSVKNN